MTLMFGRRVSRRLVVSIPAGSASAPQEYRAYASYFSDAIPASFTAAEA